MYYWYLVVFGIFCTLISPQSALTAINGVYAKLDMLIQWLLLVKLVRQLFVIWQQCSQLCFVMYFGVDDGLLRFFIIRIYSKMLTAVTILTTITCINMNRSEL